jgi:hypothetical protein
MAPAEGLGYAGAMNKPLAIALIAVTFIWDAFLVRLFWEMHRPPAGPPTFGSVELFFALSAVVLTAWCVKVARRSLNGDATRPRRTDGSRRIPLILAGLLAWLIAQTIAFLIGGAGHGWTTPSLVSFALLPLYPAALVCAFGPAILDTPNRLGLLLVAVLLDAILVSSAVWSESEYYQRVWLYGGGWVAAWCALWLAWHFVLLTALRRTAAASQQ